MHDDTHAADVVTLCVAMHVAWSVLVAMCARSVYVVVWPIGGGLVAMDEYAKMGKTTVYSPAEGQSQTVNGFTLHSQRDTTVTDRAHRRFTSQTMCVVSMHQ